MTAADNTLGWTAATGVTIAADTDHALDGGQCLKVTLTGAHTPAAAIITRTHESRFGQLKEIVLYVTGDDANEDPADFSLTTDASNVTNDGSLAAVTVTPMRVSKRWISEGGTTTISLTDETTDGDEEDPQPAAAVGVFYIDLVKVTDATGPAQTGV